MPRRYRIVTPSFTLTAASDLLQIKGASNKMVRVIRWKWKLADNSFPASQELQTRCRFLPATVTDGNGTSVTPSKVDPGDAAATLTALYNSGSKATTSGTAVIVDNGGEHVYNGYDETPASPIEVPPSTSFVFELISSPSPTFGIVVEAEVDEIG